MSNPRGWTTDTYLKTAYNAGVRDFTRSMGKSKNPYKNVAMREMWELGRKFALERETTRILPIWLEEIARARNLMNNPNEPSD